MVPLSEDLLRNLERAFPDAPESTVLSEVFEFLGPALERWLCLGSRGSILAYVETEYLAGEGFERAAVWRDEKLALGPLDGAGAINMALRALGVRGRPGQEEFHAAGLDRHRTLDEWLSDA